MFVHAGCVAFIPAARLLPAEGESAVEIAFLQRRVEADPDDLTAQNRLASLYLQRLRATGDHANIPLARKAALASLGAVSEKDNVGGLVVLAEVQAASHEFAEALRSGERLIEIDPRKANGYRITADALVELGRYEEARDVLARYRTIEGTSVATESRLARLALLEGDSRAAGRYFTSALKIAQASSAPVRETVAWCYWQLGDVAFSSGDYATAGNRYRDALTVFPDYIKAVGPLGRLQAAEGDLDAATKTYEKAVAIDPMPMFLATLGDLYNMNGEHSRARLTHARIEEGAANPLDSELDNRQLVLFYADHDLKSREAYERARRDLDAGRRDVWGLDAFAWAALKDGRAEEASRAIREAMLPGTKDARLYYHAGMIALAQGKTREGRRWLARALRLNPGFDPLQSRIARERLSRGTSHVIPHTKPAAAYGNPPE